MPRFFSMRVERPSRLLMLLSTSEVKDGVAQVAKSRAASAGGDGVAACAQIDPDPADLSSSWPSIALTIKAFGRMRRLA